MNELYKAYDFANMANTFMWYALIFVAIVFCISSLDDFFLDVVYWSHRFKKWLFRKSEKKLYYDELAAIPEKKIALLIPCWNEADVIYDMLTSNLSQIDYKNYDVYVGIYPNDPDTKVEIKKAQVKFSNLHAVVNAKDGPTTKAGNLNWVYHHILQYEKENNVKYEIFVLHDAEDLIHPLSLKLYNYAINKFDMVQTPVFPLEVPLYNFTHWVYNDEFAEMHLKNLPAREIIRGLVPSAGVGTAFSRKAIELLAENSGQGMPFSLHSVTEDYDAALQLQQAGIKATFFPFSVTRLVNKKSWFGFGPPVLRERQQIIATRSLFPLSYGAAIRQRTRWVYGIALQEWVNAGWPGTAAIRFTLLHDRKSILTHFLNGFSYIVLIYWFINYLTNGFDYRLETLSDYLSENHWMGVLIMISTVFMINRIINRTYFTGTIYGFWAAVLTIPRIIYANILNIHTSYAAMKNFLLITTKRRKLKWNKTSHSFPTQEQMAIYRRKIGDIMLDEGMISTRQLKKAMVAQRITGEKIGDLFMQYGYLNLKQLTELLAQQSHLEIVNFEEFTTLGNDQLSDLSKENYQWLLRNRLLPLDLSDDQLTIGITDPALLKMRGEIQQVAAPYQIRFVLISLFQKLGETLVARGLVTPRQIASAIEEQLSTKEKLGAILVQKGDIKPEDLTRVLSEQYNLGVVNLKESVPLTLEQLPKIDEEKYNWLKENNLTPVKCLGGVITLALTDPADELLRKKAIKDLSPYEVKFVIAFPGASIDGSREVFR